MAVKVTKKQRKQKRKEAQIMNEVNDLVEMITKCKKDADGVLHTLGSINHPEIVDLMEKALKVLDIKDIDYVKNLDALSEDVQVCVEYEAQKLSVLALLQDDGVEEVPDA